jgi:hypothetical protein
MRWRSVAHAPGRGMGRSGPGAGRQGESARRRNRGSRASDPKHLISRTLLRSFGFRAAVGTSLSLQPPRAARTGRLYLMLGIRSNGFPRRGNATCPPCAGSRRTRSRSSSSSWTDYGPRLGPLFPGIASGRGERTHSPSASRPIRAAAACPRSAGLPFVPQVLRARPRDSQGRPRPRRPGGWP